MRLALGVLLAALTAVPAHAQTVSSFTCGTFKAESSRTTKGTSWTIAHGAEKNTESAVLKKGPRFECIGGGALAVMRRGIEGLTINQIKSSKVLHPGSSTPATT